MLIAFYLVACLIVAFLGRRTMVGFFGFFIIALFTSPIVAMLFVIVSRDNRSGVTTNENLL